VRRSDGCGKEPIPPSPSVDLQALSFLLDLPASYDKTRPYPLVLAFRSMETSADEFRSQLNLASLADAIIAYPNPREIGPPLQADVAGADELISQLSAGYCVDLDHLFALGDGSGALFANLLGCLRGDQIRAIATFSNAPPPPGPCVGNTGVWLLQRNDTDPSTVGSGLGNRDFWARSNACDLRMPKPVSPSPCIEYRGCSAGSPVRFCEYTGTQWPSYAVSGAWEFFESF
jgi:poly(3-hydroxybutyrate) depolymerase